jgi:hypothetical protein
MLLQAAGLALLAAISPTALLVAAVYLGSARPRVTATLYLIGAVVMSLIMAVVLLVALRSLDLDHPAKHVPRYGFRLALGVLLLAGALLVARRRRRADPAKARQGLMARLVGDPSPRSAFVVGVLIFAPGATFLAALQVIATARADLQLTALAVLMVVFINVLFVWLPFLLFLLVPGATTRRLSAFNGWLRAHGQVLLMGTLLVVGVIMVANGIYGLTVVK